MIRPAARTAERRALMVTKTLCISADSHVVEAAEVFDGLEARFGEQAPNILKHPEYGDMLVVPGQPIRPNFGVGRYGIAGLYANDPATSPDASVKGYAGVRPGVLDPVKRGSRTRSSTASTRRCCIPSVLFAIYRMHEPGGRSGRCSTTTTTGCANYCSPGARTGCSRWPVSRCRTSTPASRSSSARRRWGISGGCIPCVPPADLPVLRPCLRAASGPRPWS